MTDTKKRFIVLGLLLVIVTLGFGLWYFFFSDFSNTPSGVKSVFSRLPMIESKLEEQEQITDIQRREKLLAKEWEKLNEMKAVLDQQQQNIDKLEAELEQRQILLEERERELAAAQEKLESTLVNIKELAKYYELMEPRSAANIFGTLKDDFVIQLLKNMKKDRVAEILSLLDANKAAAITQKMSGL